MGGLSWVPSVLISAAPSSVGIKGVPYGVRSKMHSCLKRSPFLPPSKDLKLPQCVCFERELAKVVERAWSLVLTRTSGISQVTRSTSFLLKALLPPRLAATHSWTVRAEVLGLGGLYASALAPALAALPLTVRPGQPPCLCAGPCLAVPSLAVRPGRPPCPLRWPLPCCSAPHCEAWAGGSILSLASPGPTSGQMIPPTSIGSQPSVDLDQQKGRNLGEISQFPSSSSLPGTTLRPCPYRFFGESSTC